MPERKPLPKGRGFHSLTNLVKVTARTHCREHRNQGRAAPTKVPGLNSNPAPPAKTHPPSNQRAPHNNGAPAPHDERTHTGHHLSQTGSTSRGNHALIAQLVERPPCKRKVAGSSPADGTKRNNNQGSKMTKVNPRREQGRTRDKVRARVIREETHCWLCGNEVDKTIQFAQGEHKKTCKKPSCNGCILHPLSPEADEIIPVSKGGSHIDRKNIRLAHRICNQKRGNKNIGDYRVQRLKPLKTSRQWR